MKHPCVLNVVFRLFSLRRATDYSRNYAHILAASLQVGVPGTDQVVHQTNQVVRTMPKSPSENTA